MSCHERGGNFACTSLAKAVTTADEATVKVAFHALHREAKKAGAPDPTREELSAFIDRQSLRTRTAPELDSQPKRRERILQDLESLRDGPLPTGPKFHAMQNILGRAEADHMTARAAAARAATVPVPAPVPAPGPAALPEAGVHPKDREKGSPCGVQAPDGACGRTVNRTGTCGVRHSAAWDDTTGAWTDTATGEIIDGPPPADPAAATVQAALIEAGEYPPYRAPDVISHTAANSFGFCEDAYKQKYLDGTPEGPDSTEDRVVGIAVHLAAEQVMSLPAGQRTPEATAEAIGVVLGPDPEPVPDGPTDKAGAAQEAEQAATRISEEDLADPKGRGARKEARQIAGLSPEGRAKAVLLATRWHEMRDPADVAVVGREVKVEGVFAGRRATGSIDLLAREPDGTLTVEDLKTGKAPQSAKQFDDNGDEIASETPDPAAFTQLVQYAALAEQQGLGKVSRVRMVYPAAGKTVEVDLDSPYGEHLRRYADNYYRVSAARIEKACETGQFDCCDTKGKRARCGYADSHPALDRTPSQLDRAVREHRVAATARKARGGPVSPSQETAPAA